MGRNVASTLKTYNSTKHYTTNMTPHEAKREDNKLNVWLSIKDKAEFNRTYTPLSVGSFVRIYEPRKHKKGYKSVWSSKVFNIIFMGDNGYVIDDFAKKKGVST